MIDEEIVEILAPAEPAEPAFGGSFLRFVTPSDTRALKNRIDGYVKALDGAVAANPKIPTLIRAGWQAFSQGWRTFFNEEDSWWHAGAQMDQGEVYEKSVGDWQRTLAIYGDTGAPTIATLADSGAASLATLKTVAIVGGVIVGSLVLLQAFATVRPLLPSRARK